MEGITNSGSDTENYRLDEGYSDEVKSLYPIEHMSRTTAMNELKRPRNLPAFVLAMNEAERKGMPYCFRKKDSDERTNMPF
jgi:hypothetical protein